MVLLANLMKNSAKTSQELMPTLSIYFWKINLPHYITNLQIYSVLYICSCDNCLLVFDYFPVCKHLDEASESEIFISSFTHKVESSLKINYMHKSMSCKMSKSIRIMCECSYKVFFKRSYPWGSFCYQRQKSDEVKDHCQLQYPCERAWTVFNFPVQPCPLWGLI